MQHYDIIGTVLLLAATFMVYELTLGSDGCYQAPYSIAQVNTNNVCHATVGASFLPSSSMSNLLHVLECLPSNRSFNFQCLPFGVYTVAYCGHIDQLVVYSFVSPGSTITHVAILSCHNNLYGYGMVWMVYDG
jgi:hypothetical protein